MELFEQIRRDFEFETGASIKSVAKKHGVHRRMVRQALADAIPADRKVPERKCPQIDSVAEFIDQILETDGKAPRNSVTHPTGSGSEFGRRSRRLRWPNRRSGDTSGSGNESWAY